jgi:protein deglycase
LTYSKNKKLSLTQAVLLIGSFDALAIPGGFEVYGFYNDAYDDKFLDLIRGFQANNKFFASICAGALPLGKSGVLKDRKDKTYINAIRQRELLRNADLSAICKFSSRLQSS